MLLQPDKRGTARKSNIQQSPALHRDIHGTPGMVLAVTGGRADPQHIVDRLALGQLAPHHFGLPFDTAKCGNKPQINAVSRRRGLHLPPSLGSLRHQPVYPSVGIDICLDEDFCFSK